MPLWFHGADILTEEPQQMRQKTWKKKVKGITKNTSCTRPKTANVKMDRVLKQENRDTPETGGKQPQVWRCDTNEIVEHTSLTNFRPVTSNPQADAKMLMFKDTLHPSKTGKTEIWKRDPLSVVNPESFQVLWSSDLLDSDTEAVLWSGLLKHKHPYLSNTEAVQRKNVEGARQNEINSISNPFMETIKGVKFKHRQVQASGREAFLNDALQSMQQIVKAEFCSREVLRTNFEVGIMGCAGGKKEERKCKKENIYWSSSKQDAVERTQQLLKLQRRFRTGVESTENLSRKYLVAATKSSSLISQKRLLIAAEQDARQAVIRAESVASVGLVSLETMFNISIETTARHAREVEKVSDDSYTMCCKKTKQQAVWDRHVESLWKEDEQRFENECKAIKEKQHEISGVGQLL